MRKTGSRKSNLIIVEKSIDKRRKTGLRESNLIIVEKSIDKIWALYLKNAGSEQLRHDSPKYNHKLSVLHSTLQQIKHYIKNP